jgi:hypothetical protein
MFVAFKLVASQYAAAEIDIPTIPQAKKKATGVFTKGSNTSGTWTDPYISIDLSK